MKQYYREYQKLIKPSLLTRLLLVVYLLELYFYNFIVFITITRKYQLRVFSILL